VRLTVIGQKLARLLLHSKGVEAPIAVTQLTLKAGEQTFPKFIQTVRRDNENTH
jgi:hypothetical protein